MLIVVPTAVAATYAGKVAGRDRRTASAAINRIYINNPCLVS